MLVEIIRLKKDIEQSDYEQQKTVRRKVFGPTLKLGDKPKLTENGKHGFFWNLIPKLSHKSVGSLTIARLVTLLFTAQLRIYQRELTCQNATPFMPNLAGSPQ